MRYFCGLLMVLVTSLAVAAPKVVKSSKKKSVASQLTKTLESSNKLSKENSLPEKASPTEPTIGPTLNAKQAILIEARTGEVLFEKNADEAMPPSSMSKILTTYAVFDALKNGQITLDQTFPISEKAWRMGGSKMFLTLNSQVKIEDLLRGIIIQSGNDACVAVAEGLAGSEEIFAQNLTKLAHDLGATHSHFTNATGWPDEQHYSTARDLALIAQRQIEKYPDYYRFYSETEFTYNNIRQPNRNPLLGHYPGADGIKTGRTDGGGYGLIGSAIQEGRRLILVINGNESQKKRAIDAKALLTWGFTHFASACVFKAGQPLDQAEVWLGTHPHVSLTIGQDFNVVVPRTDLRDLKLTLVYQGPLKAPLTKGQAIGQLILSQPQKPDRVIPVLVGADVPQASFLARLQSSFIYLFKGHP